ncbi:hypothetical protein [Gilvimarinus japonicus]|jgi:hypothetical protein|uniref:Lipoprotein n=1 Tax=Gilvimarinus japonicus TaxID=1796469 RepID=A0ABV7HMW7_9GAMM
MSKWVIAGLVLGLSACGQSDNGTAAEKKGAFEAYTDSQAKALEQAKDVENTLKEAEQARRKQLEQAQ